MTQIDHILALDIGQRHTGVAYADTQTDIPLPLDTIHHTNDEELKKAVDIVLTERSITVLVVGLPLLPDGQEGAQAQSVRSAVDTLCVPDSISIEYIDERYTSVSQGNDGHAAAACSLLSVYLGRAS